MDSHARPARFPFAGGRSGATVRLHPLSSGERRPKGRFGRGGDAPWRPVCAYLAVHPEAGPLLVDCGLHPSVAHDPAQNLGRGITRRLEARAERDQALDEQLRRRNLSPEAIPLVLMTHLHAEQVSAAALLSGATFLLDAREWRAASDDETGYEPRLVDFPFDWRSIDYADERIDAFATFGRAVDVFGDGSVRLLSTPGHSPGHQSVLLRLADREALICGDAAAPDAPADEHLARRTLGELRRFAELTPSARIHPPEALLRG